jgi:hypothetical protein
MPLRRGRNGGVSASPGLSFAISAWRWVRMCSRRVAARSESCSSSRLAILVSCWRACRSVVELLVVILERLGRTRGLLVASAAAR